MVEDLELKHWRDAGHVARRALEGIKGEIVDEFAEGFKEIKVNYKKVDYGRPE